MRESPATPNIGVPLRHFESNARGVDDIRHSINKDLQGRKLSSITGGQPMNVNGSARGISATQGQLLCDSLPVIAACPPHQGEEEDKCHSK
jgi:hypothetical protein